MINGLLIFIMIVSGGVALYIIISKFPQLAHLNVKKLPEHQQSQIKRQILEDTLRRDLQQRWKVAKDFFSGERRQRVTSWFSNVYQRLKELEQGYRHRRTQDLSQQVSKSASLEQLIASAKEALQQDNLVRAEQLLLEGVKLDEHNTTVFRLLASVYRDKGEFDHAKETLEYILRLKHQHEPEPYVALGDLARARGNLQEAVEHYRKAIGLDDANFQYYLDLARIFKALGDNQASLEQAQRALILAGNSPKILDFLIENSIILQDKERAGEYLARLKEVNAENGKIDVWQKRIEELP